MKYDFTYTNPYSGLETVTKDTKAKYDKYTYRVTQADKIGSIAQITENRLE